MTSNFVLHRWHSLRADSIVSVRRDALHATAVPHTAFVTQCCRYTTARVQCEQLLARPYCSTCVTLRHFHLSVYKANSQHSQLLTLASIYLRTQCTHVIMHYTRHGTGDFTPKIFVDHNAFASPADKLIHFTVTSPGFGARGARTKLRENNLRVKRKYYAIVHQSINQSNKICTAPPTNSGRRRLTIKTIKCS